MCIFTTRFWVGGKYALLGLSLQYLDPILQVLVAIYALVILFSEVWERLNSHSTSCSGSVQHGIYDVPVR